MTHTDDKLPGTLSGTLRAAIEDARSIDRTGLYRPNAQIWHTPIWRLGTAEQKRTISNCYVCLGGMVLAQRYEWPIEERYCGYGMIPRGKLLAIDNARVGRWTRAWQNFYHFPRAHEELADYRLCEELNALPTPAMGDFKSWEALDSNLADLEAVLPRLEEIEAKYRPEAS